MTRQSVESFLASNGWRIAGLIIAGTVAWMGLTAAVKGKLDKSEFVDYRSERAALDSTIARDLRVIKALECRDTPADSFCIHP